MLTPSGAPEHCPAECTPDYVFTGSDPAWTITAWGGPGTGNEFCESCTPCTISITWSYSPATLTRYKINWQNGGGVRGAAGGAAGTADGNFSYEMGCDQAWVTQESFEDQSGTVITGTPFCTCAI
jgi:hypothetical protein